MFKAILNQRQQKLGACRQITLALCSVAHLCILYTCIFVAPQEGGASSLFEFFKNCISEIIKGGVFIKQAVLFTVMLLTPTAAIIISSILYFRKNYILATETSRGLLTLLFCYVAAYSGYVLFATLLCSIWLFGLIILYTVVLRT